MPAGRALTALVRAPDGLGAGPPISARRFLGGRSARGVVRGGARLHAHTRQRTMKSLCYEVFCELTAPLAALTTGRHHRGTMEKGEQGSTRWFMCKLRLQSGACSTRGLASREVYALSAVRTSGVALGCAAASSAPSPAPKTAAGARQPRRAGKGDWQKEKTGRSAAGAHRPGGPAAREHPALRFPMGRLTGPTGHEADTLHATREAAAGALVAIWFAARPSSPSFTSDASGDLESSLQ